MERLFDVIRASVAANKYVVGEHASQRLEERGIMEWQVVVGVANGKPTAEHSGAKPHPSVEVIESLPDGSDCKAVWSHLRRSGVAKLVTVYFFDEA